MNNPAPRNTGRSGAAVTKREFDGLRAEIITRFDDLSKQIQAMLPREIYEVRQRQVTDDMDDLHARIAKLETSNIDLNTQLLSVKQATAQTPQQITSSAMQMRADAMAKGIEMASRIAFMLGGALLTFIAYYLGNHLH
ncbi:MAG TPA: hypothetical protein VFU63_00195 [Ktedonobacterales bacterium]|nr:hypothetical protein [Ktedonobacterales bacterium]